MVSEQEPDVRVFNPIESRAAAVSYRYWCPFDSSSNERRRRGIFVAPGVSPGITTPKESKPAVAGDRFGVRWHSAAPTPLWIVGSSAFRRGQTKAPSPLRSVGALQIGTWFRWMAVQPLNDRESSLNDRELRPKDRELPLNDRESPLNDPESSPNDPEGR
jgi:hypothetical protein